MRITFGRNTNSIRLWDWLLVLGITLAPMNALRIWKIGPAEILCLLWCMRQINAILRIKLSDFMMRFWILFILVISLGSLYGTAYYPDESNISGLLTYFYFAVIAIGIYAGIQSRELQHTEALLRTICIVASVWYMFLFIYSQNVSPTFWGAPLWYGGRRFSGGADNPHQLAVLMSALIFGNIRCVLKGELSRFTRLIHALACVCCSIVAIATESATLIVSIIITLLVLVYWFTLSILKEPQLKKAAAFALIAATALIAIAFWERIIDFVYQWIASDKNGLGRLQIFSSITNSLQKSFFIGMGPGTHGMNGTIEYHNMYLEILAMGGIFGFGIFAFFSLRLFLLHKKPINEQV